MSTLKNLSYESIKLSISDWRRVDLKETKLEKYVCMNQAKQESCECSSILQRSLFFFFLQYILESELQRA